MKRIYLVTALHTSVHAAFLGSKVVLSLLALQLGADASMVGLLIGCYAVPPLLLSVHVGRLADRIGMRAPMIAGAAFVAAAMVTGWLWGALHALFVVAAMVGLGFALYMVSSQNVVGGLEGNRTRNYSILTIGYSISNILGPMVAGFAIEYVGHAGTLLIFAFFPLPAIAILVLHRALTRVDLPPAPDTPRRTTDLLRHGPLMRTILISGLQMAAWELYIFFVPIYGHSIGLSPSDIGTILGSFAIATFVVRFAIPVLTARLRVETLLSVAMVMAAAACVVFPFLRDVHALWAVSFVIGLGMGCGHPLSLSLSFDRSPAGRSGEATGLRVTVTNSARVAVPILTGLFGAALGPAALLWLNAMVLVGTGYIARKLIESSGSTVYLIVLLSVAIHACYIGSKVVVSLLALDLGASQLLIGVIASLYAVLPLALGLYSGRLADTIGMRVPLLIGALLTGLAMLCGFLWQTLPALFIVAILMGAAFVFWNVSIQNLAGAYGPPEQRARNFSILTIGYSMSTFTGPMIAGFTIDYAGHASAFLAFALLTLFPIALLSFYPKIVRVTVPAAEKAERRAIDLLRDPPLRRVIIMSGLMVASYELFGFYMPVFGHSIGLSASMIGVIMGTYATATFLTRFFLPLVLRAWKAQQVLFAAMLLAASGFLLMPFLREVYFIMATTFTIGLGLGVGQPISMTMAFNQSPAGRTGEVTGLRLTANNVARIVIPLTAGALGAAFGMVPVFWMNAANLATISWLAKR